MYSKVAALIASMQPAAPAESPTTRRADRVCGRVVAAGDALGLGVDEEQREPLLLARRTGGAGEHDVMVGGRSVVDPALVAGERPAGAFLGGLEHNVARL